MSGNVNRVELNTGFDNTNVNRVELNMGFNSPVDRVEIDLVPGNVDRVQLDMSPGGNPIKQTTERNWQELKGQLQFFVDIASGPRVLFNKKGEEEKADALKEKYLWVREIVLENRGIDPNGEDLEFNINFSYGKATYIDPETLQRVNVDLWNLSDPKDQKFVDRFFEDAHELLNFPRAHFDKSNKGNPKGERALVHGKTPEWQPLPKSFDECARSNVAAALAILPADERKVVTKRLLFVEAVHGWLTKRLKKEINDNARFLRVQLQVLKNYPHDLHKQKTYAALKKQQDELQRVQKELATIDFYALTLALCNYPVHLGLEPEKQIKERASQIETGVLKVLKYDEKKAQGEFGILKSKFSKDQTLSDEMNAERAKASYAKDIAGLLFLNRWDYHEYCSSKGMPMKTEGVIDGLLRMAIAYGNGEEATVFDNFFPSICKGLEKNSIDDMSVDALFDITNRIPELQDSDLSFDNRSLLPANATQQQKNQTNALIKTRAAHEFNQIRGRIKPEPIIEELPSDEDE